MRSPAIRLALLAWALTWSLAGVGRAADPTPCPVAQGGKATQRVVVGAKASDRARVYEFESRPK